MKLLYPFLMVLLAVCKFAQSQNAPVDLGIARLEIADIIQQFSLDYHNADSVALGKHYASDGSFGAVKGSEQITGSWGSFIRSSHAKGFTTVVYHSNAMATDGEYVTELGDYQIVDKNNQPGYKGKYCVVWKQENGQWKIYRDIGL